MTVSNRDARRNRFTPEWLEGRLAPSSMSPGSGPPQEVRHEDHGGGQDNGNWEPKPIGNSSTRPTIPNGPTGPVRWQGDRFDHDRGDHDRGDDRDGGDRSP
jgi:hypothetical protein